ncbi:MAG TPA: type II secretion system F family protein [Methanocellaceae archaeon]|jgi:archaellum biogenesis protein FlaJ (TadC family)
MPEKCFEDWMYETLMFCIGAFMLVVFFGITLLSLQALYGTPVDVKLPAFVICLGICAAFAIYQARAYAVSSMKNYRGALIDANVAHAVGFMLTMAESNVPLKKMFANLSNLGDVYGEDIALESTYILSLVEEDGMDVISAIKESQSISPSMAWQELLIGISEVYGSGGSLYAYLKNRYETMGERKRMDVRKYNESVQGLSSIYLSAIGISAIFISIINLVFNMAGWLANDSLVWLDAVAIVPLGSFIIVKVLRATDPEA